jgi:hypothetical protein
MTWQNALNIAGLLMNLIGVILLFRYGMPYRVRSGGNAFYVSSHSDQAEVAAERLYERLGLSGLILIVLGTAAQIGANIF